MLEAHAECFKLPPFRKGAMPDIRFQLDITYLSIQQLNGTGILSSYPPKTSYLSLFNINSTTHNTEQSYLALILFEISAAGSHPPPCPVEYMTGIGAPAWHRMTPLWGHLPTLCPDEHYPSNLFSPSSFFSVPVCLGYSPFGDCLYIPIVPRMPLGRH